MTWGDEDWGGDCSDVRDKLTKVVQLCGSGAAFAAISANGSVVTWGSAPSSAFSICNLLSIDLL